jgi:peptidoglycan hydrolase CwlO-like protein
MENKKTIIITVVATFIIGLIIGYGITDKKKYNKSDVKQLLNLAITEIESLEKEHNNLKKNLASLNRDKVIKKNASITALLKKTRKDNESLQAEMSKLKGQIAHTELQLESKEEFKKVIDNQRARIAELEKEKGAIKNQNARISELEKEKEDLQLIIDRIVSVTQNQGIDIQQGAPVDVEPAQ